MSVKMGNPKRSFARAIRAKRKDGSVVSIEEYRISGTDPTATGTIWSMPMSYNVHRLASGEPVDCYDDGTAMITNTGEMLTLL